MFAGLSQDSGNPQINGLGIIVLSGLLEQLFKALCGSMCVFQVQKSHPDIEFLVFLSVIDGPQSATSNLSCLVDFREFELERHVLHP